MITGFSKRITFTIGLQQSLFAFFAALADAVFHTQHTLVAFLRADA